MGSPTNLLQTTVCKQHNAFKYLKLLSFAVWTGLEPATPCVTGMYSNQLNYQTLALGACKYTRIFGYTKAKRILTITVGQLQWRKQPLETHQPYDQRAHHF